MFKQKVQPVVLVASLATAGLALILEGTLGFALFICTLLIILVVTRRSFNDHNNKLIKTQWWLIGTACLLTLLPVFRASPVLNALSYLGLAIIALLALAIAYSEKNPVKIAIATLLSCPFKVLGYLVSTLPGFTIQAAAPFVAINSTKRHYLRSIIFGLLWATPLLLLFGGLLIASDPRFQHFAESIFSFNAEQIMLTGVEFGCYWFITLIFFYLTLAPGVGQAKSSNEILQQTTKASISVDSIQVLTVLASINLLFFAYIGVQLTYFFGGDKLVLNTDNLSYATYAKQGFWELVFVAMLVIPVLLVVDALQTNKPSNIKKWCLRLSILTIVATAIIELSALHRMALYLKNYSLTELRFYSTAFLFFIMSIFICYAVTVLRQKRGAFVLWSSSTALSFILILNIINPDALIAKANLENKFSNIKPDTSYLSSLSEDAYPVIADYIQENPTKNWCNLLVQFNYRLQGYNNASWQQWNWSIDQAQQVVASLTEKQDCKIMTYLQ
ncbi:DUF4153 domain-containing protein [Spartinivicinus poritis]|uniref:DUF4173 domain-containing protein n=1 Tax=Spartinivicinus poritis TaxID=2994640 RepID=A0ABT5UDD8_9GAMM|nr:DUF4173 domain-containing protein [Spartinivicinus sp. A2-2]MDE1464391.1 DUF4173 domain-containing protein [Spartinivicinus sp. A2-2]